MIIDVISVKRDTHLVENQNWVTNDASPFGIFIVNPDHEIVFIDDIAKAILSVGFDTVGEFQNVQALWKSSIAITTERGDPITYEDSPLNKALKTSKTQSDVLVILVKNGGKQFLSLQCSSIISTQSSMPFSVVCYVADITDSRQKQQTKIFFKEFFNQTSNLLWMIDEQMNLLFANKAFGQYFGLKANDLGRKITEVVPEAVASALYEDHFRVLQATNAIKKEQKVRLADGTTSDFLIHLFPFTDAEGNKMAGGHAVYLADRYEIEKQLREANEKLLSWTYVAHDAIWEWDLRSGRIFRNEHLLNMIGYLPENTNDLDWWLECIHPEDRKKLSATLKEATEKKQMSWEQSYRFRCGNGSYKHVVDRGFIVYENNVPVKMIGSLKDVTELKELETRLAEEKLQKQKEISETMIQVQERERIRLGVELHDNVNQILTSLRLYIAMLTPGKPGEKEIKDKCVGYVDTAMEEIRKLSKELVVPQLTKRSLVENIKSLVNEINCCSALKITFTYSHEIDLLSPGKKLALFRIIQEQVKNVLKYSKAEEASIYLQYKIKTVALTIKDKGVGFNLKKTLRGVGLSSIYERTRFYNGKVEIKTAEGKGCVLKIEIPIS